MRTIKFRAWWKEGKRMLCPATPLHTGGITWGDQGYDSNQKDYVVEQFTGLHDKNGKEIYEGDIIRTAFQSSAWGRKIAAFEKGGFQAVPFGDHETITYPLYMMIQGHVFDVEVIGNQWENPELLEASK